MSFYESGGNLTGSMVPGNVPSYTQPHSLTPTHNKVIHRPSSVSVAGMDAGGLMFNFTTTGSVGATVGTNGTWVAFGAAASGSTLEISPTAWKSNANTAGTVVFNYANGRPDGDDGE